MSPFLKLLASVSSLAIISSNFFAVKIAKAMESDHKNDNIPIIRLNPAAQENDHNQFANLVDTLVSSQLKTDQIENIKLAQAAPPSNPSIIPGVLNLNTEDQGGDAS